MTPLLLVLSAPSGAGKTTIARQLVAQRDDVVYSISATTRAPRKGEREGVDYYFISREEFARRERAGAFLEWAEYNGNWYGTPADGVDRMLRSGRHVILEIEVQGARSVRKRRADVVSIFILPPSADVLLDRLGARGTDASEDVRKRVARAVDELQDAAGYDYIVVNSDRDRAVADLFSIVTAESLRAHRREGLIDELSDLRRRLAAAAEELKL